LSDCKNTIIHTVIEASPRNTPSLTTSVTVVRKMHEAVAGSAPVLLKEV
jgi:hypothetical protein